MVHDILVLCACTATLLFSALAVKIASCEVKTGRSRTPLKTDPRHQRHRRQQRARSRARRNTTNNRPEAYDVSAEVAEEIRDATAAEDSDTIHDHESIARAIIPASHRLRGPMRSQTLTDRQRREVYQVHRLIQKYAVESPKWTHWADRDELRQYLHLTARDVHQTYQPGSRDPPDDRSTN